MPGVTLTKGGRLGHFFPSLPVVSSCPFFPETPCMVLFAL